MMTNTKMSVFNRYKEPFTNNVSYKKHVVEHVFWDDSLGINLNTGYENADKVNIYIPFDKNKSDLENYKEPKQYNGNGWTLQNGDFIIKGEVAESEVDGIKDLKAYEVFEITVIDKKDFGSYNMQHFEIRGQ
jgi:hypothetical protein